MSLTIGMLSWGQQKTLRNTLESYRRFNLLSKQDEKVIFFQEISDEDLEIADEYGFSAIGSTRNLGIAEGYKNLVKVASGRFFLFLENDWELLRDPQEQITQAIGYIGLGTCEVVRFRDRENPGNPLWSRQFEGNELSRPEHLLDSIHWTDPSKFPQIYTLGDFYATSARYANWTNNPHLAETSWLKENILPRIGGDIEKGLQDWWQQQKFIVAQGQGLFTHKRLG